MKHFLTFLLLICTPLALVSQTLIQGVVLDENTKESLAFVHIISESGRGATTDIDGKFQLSIRANDSFLKLSYVGYHPAQIVLDGKKTYSIKLKPKTFHLDEVEVFPGINPAHRIINNVIDNRDNNDPQKLDAFTYTSYDKLNVFVDADSLLMKDTALLDSTERKARNFIEKQDVFLVETVTERKYMSPGMNQENVLATRVSGLKDPIMAFMISQIQSTSFYDERIQIAGNTYINPISSGSTKKYFFLIEDTLYTEAADTVFIISFRPMMKTKFDGMKGFLSINSRGWAIQNVKAEPKNDSTGIVIKIQQSYEFIQDHWFPNQLNTDIIFTNMQVAAEGGDAYNLVGKGRSYIKDLDLNPDLKKSDFGFHEVEIASDATKKKGEFWSEHRTDSLTPKELETYRVIDSIGRAENFDRMASTFQTLMVGRIPIKWMDIDLDKIIHYNAYEGLYLGVGAHTNDQLSKTISFGGFWGYGFQDQAAKYGGDLLINIHKPSESSLHLEAYNKVTPSGGTSFFDDKGQLWKTNYFDQFFIKRMNPTRGAALDYSFRIRAMRDFKWNVGISIDEKETYEDYYFADASDSLAPHQTSFTYNTFSLGFKFSYRERIIQTTKGALSMGSEHPTLWINYSRGSNVFMADAFQFNRIDLKIEDHIHINYFGDFSYQIMAGFVDRALPVSNLFNANGTYRTFTLFAPNSFGTMRTNEFFSDRYIALFLSHNFGNLLFPEGNFQPELVLLTNITFGELSKPDYHNNITYNTLEKGYYESGLLIRKLLDLRVYDLGLGIMYRYGPYGFDNAADNFAYKISLFYGF